MATKLKRPTRDAPPSWLKRLLDGQLVQSAGRTQATRYFVDPGLLCSLNFTGETTLKRIEPHRLAALVLEDQRYPKPAISDIHQRVGGEIQPKQVKCALEELIERGAVRLKATIVGGGTGRCHESAIGQPAAMAAWKRCTQMKTSGSPKR